MENMVLLSDDEKQTLAFLYLKNYDLRGKSPNEIVDFYIETRKQIDTHLKEKPADIFK